MPQKDILKFNKPLLDRPINLSRKIGRNKFTSEPLLDQSINLSRKTIVRNNKFALEPLPEPLKPTPYVAPKPKPKPRKKAPVTLPRNQLPKKVDKKVKKLIDEITPYYTPKAIRKFKKDLKFIKRVEITEKKKALKGNVANYSLSIVNENDPSMQLSRTRDTIEEKLKSLIKEKRKGLKFGESLKLRMKQEDHRS